MPEGVRAAGRQVVYTSPHFDDRGRPNLVIGRAISGAFHFAYGHGAEFLIAPDGRDVSCAWPDSLTVGEASVYLRGPVLGLVLRLRGIVSLHASSVAVGARAVALLGTVGAGKSTTAAALVEAGCRLLSDDVSAIRMEHERPFVLPGIPRVSLWPDAAAALYGTGRTLPRLTRSDGVLDWWDKRYIDIDPARFCQAPLPLSAVYVLGARTDAQVTPRVEPLSPKDAFIALTDETYVNYALDAAMRAREFQVLGDVVRSVSVRRLLASDDAARLPELCRTILDDHASHGR